MPTDLEKLKQDKEKIISFISRNGPSLPVSISRAIGSSPLFTSAFLSELNSERKIKMSNMKVGSSPLYLLPEQEPQLEKFIDHLNHREKEAFQKLKESKVLEDETLEPVTRVALRSIKDFAIPVRIRINESAKIFWKFFTLSDEDLKKTLQGQPLQKEQKESQIQEKEKQEETTIQQNQKETKFESPIEKRQEQSTLSQETPKAQEKEQENQNQESQKEKEKQEEKPSPKKETKENPFTEKLKAHLSSRNIELLSILSEKKKEVTAKVSINTHLGKHPFFLLAKDKKKVNENDLTIAIQNAQTKKLSAIVASTGDLDKKASSYLDDWSGLVKFEKIR